VKKTGFFPSEMMEGKKERKTRVSREGISISLPTTMRIPL